MIQHPVADLGIDTIATGLAISTQCVDVDGAMAARIEIDVIIAPRILGQTLQIAALAPIGRRRIAGGLAHQRLQALIGARIAEVIQPVHIERILNRADVLARLGLAGIVRRAEKLGNGNSGKNTEDDHHHQNLDQGKAALSGHGPCSWVLYAATRQRWGLLYPDGRADPGWVSAICMFAGDVSSLPARAESKAIMNPKTDNDHWRGRDLRHVWHPCTQMKDHEWLEMIPIRRAEGVWLEDYNGQRYLDAISSWWVNLFGHGHPAIADAVSQQMHDLEHVMLAGFSHAPAIELAERLCAIAPGPMQRVFYGENGSSAIEIALKMSFHYWHNQGQKRSRFIALGNSYHGETLGALAVGDVALYKATYGPLLLEPIVAPSPDAWLAEPGETAAEFAARRLKDLEALLEQHHTEVSALIFEPLVQCAGGMRMYHPDYLRGAEKLCRHYNVHMIADEIATGFGRTGTMFACEQAGIEPDFVCLSKGLTGGSLPLSAVLTTEQVYQAFYHDYDSLRGFLHSHSYTGNPVCCRAALAVLDLFEQGDVIADNRRLATRILEQTKARLADHPHVGEIRQNGMITAIEMVPDRNSREPYPWQQRRGIRVYRHGLANSMLLRPLGNVVYFMPPYVITPEQIDDMVRVAAEGIDVATRSKD